MGSEASPWTRLAGEFDRTTSEGASALCLVARVDRLERLRRERGEELAEQLLSASGRGLESGLAGSSGQVVRDGDEWIALVPRSNLEQAEGLACAVLNACRAEVAPLIEGATGWSMSLGVSHDARGTWRQFQTLVEVARRGAEVATQRGGNRWVHTELYGLYESPNTPRASAAGVSSSRVSSGGAAAIPSQPPPQPVEVEAARPTASPPSAEALVSQLLERAAHDAELRARLLGELRGWGGTGSEKSDPVHQRVDLLERRIAKLIAALNESEQRWQKAGELIGSEPGLASVYREVQGLTDDEQHFELKQHLMEQILEENLALRTELEEGSHPSLDG